jgi:hypothetical protein
MRVGIATDHGGFSLKGALITRMDGEGHETERNYIGAQAPATGGSRLVAGRHGRLSQAELQINTPRVSTASTCRSLD